MVLGQRLVGPDVCALGRVQLVAWRREATTPLPLSHSKSESKSIFNHGDGQLTSSARDRAGEEVSLSPLVSNWFVEQKLDNGVLGASVLYLHSTTEEGGHSGQREEGQSQALHVRGASAEFLKPNLRSNSAIFKHLILKRWTCKNTERFKAFEIPIIKWRTWSLQHSNCCFDKTSTFQQPSFFNTKGVWVIHHTLCSSG